MFLKTGVFRCIDLSEYKVIMDEVAKGDVYIENDNCPAFGDARMFQSVQIQEKVLLEKFWWISQDIFLKIMKIFMRLPAGIISM